MDELQERPPLAVSHQTAQPLETEQDIPPDIQLSPGTPPEAAAQEVPGQLPEQTGESVGQQAPPTEQTAPSSPSATSTPPGIPEDVWAALVESSNTTAQDESPATPVGTTIEATVEGDKGIIDTITDTLKGINNAPLSAVNEVMDLSYSVGKFAVDVFKDGWSKAQFFEHDAPVRFPEYKPQTVVGGIAKSLAQWGSGFLMTGLVGKAPALAGKALGISGKSTSAAGRAAAALGKGAVADTVFFDRQEKRISNFIQQFPELRNPVTEFLEARPDDPVPLSMLKMALEGAGLGATTEVFITGLKCLRSGAKTLWGKANSRFSPEQYRKDAGELEAALNKQKGTEEGTPEATKELAIPKEGQEAGAKAPPKNEAGSAPESLQAKIAGEQAHGSAGASPKGYLNPDQLAPASDVLKIIKKAAKEDKPLAGVREGINLNHEVFDKTGGSHVLSKLSDLQVENTIKAAGPEKYGELVSSAVDEVKQMGFTYDINLNEGKEALASIRQAEKTVLKVRAVMHNLCDASMTLANKINNGTASALDAVRFVMLSKNMQEFVTLNSDLRTVSGRLLGSRNIGVSDELAHTMSGTGDADAFIGKWLSAENMTESDAVEYLVKSGLSRDMIMDVARRTIISDNPIGNVRVLKQLKPEFKTLDALVEMRVNGMLSGPTTHLVNTFSTGANMALVKPVERMVGGALSLDMQAVRSGWNLIRGMSDSVGLAWEMAGKALRVGDNILDRNGNRLEYQTHQLSYERIRNSLLKNAPEGTELSAPQEILARAAGWLGTTFRIPSRLLVAEDEFFKQLGFRGQIYASLSEEAAQKGIKGKDIKAYMEERLKDVFDENGSIIKNDLTDRAMSFARDGSWTSPLESNSLGGRIQQMANEHVPIKLIIPFIKTPMNLFYDAVRHNPAAALSGNVRKAIAAGGEARADALGRMATGSLLIASGLSMAAEGRITGAYPENPKLKALWKENGIKPYSLKVGDNWLEYRRFDPIGLILSASCDAYNHVTEESYDRTGKLDTSPVALKALTGVLMAVVENLNDKTYVQGVADAMKAINEPKRYAQSYINKTSTSFIPYSGLLRWYKNYQGDPQQRETESWLDYMRNTTSAFSKDLPPKTSWLTGKPVLYSGHIVEPQKHDVVLKELLRLGSSVMGAPAKEIEGVPLDAKQYSRLCELHGGIRLPDGRNMYDVLHDAMQSEGYDMKRQRLGDGIPGQRTPRSELVNGIINTFREIAQAQLRKEYPDITEKIKQAWVNKKASKAGAMTKDNQQTLLNNLIH